MELSVIQQESLIISTKLISTCQVNGFFREYIISRPMEDNLVFALEGHCSLNSHRTGQHLAIGNSWDRDEAVFKSMDLSRLRSLTVFGEWRSFLISSSGSNMRLLRALDLEDTTNLTDDDLYKIGKLPPRLKFLSLRRCIHITFLPDSVGKLRQLQTLDVRGTSIVTMPESIINLHKLRYIRAGITIDSAASTPPHVSSWLPDVCSRHRLVGVHVPEEIGKLNALHTLGVINVAASGAKAFLPELKKLTQLRKLGVSGINKHNSKHFFAAISDHGHFESLSVRLNKDNNQGCCLDGIPLPLKNLQSLKLHGLNDKLPEWGSDRLSKLAKLDLEMATLLPGDIEFLGKLPQLCILRIKQLQDPELHFQVLVNGEEGDCYQKVKVLEIACSTSSSSFHVNFGCKAMKKLELFKVDCQSVSSIKLHGLNDKLPEWGSDRLDKLVKLDLKMDTLMEGDIKFLGKLALQLHKLGVSGINRNNSEQFFSAISDHDHFESLSVCLNKDNNQGCCLDGIPLPLKNLRSLKLHGLNEKLPDWGSDHLSKLIKLDLEMATLMEGDIEFLGKLPQLCILRIKQLQDPELHFHALVNGEENDCYEKVKVLEIACSSSSSSFQVTFGCKAMKKLELFKVNCPSVSSFQFSGLEHLSELKEFLRN